MEKSRTKAGIIQMTVCSTLWSSAGIFIKLVDWPAFAIAGYRGLVSGIVVLLYMLLAKVKIVINKRVVISTLFISVTAICFVCANKLTAAANAIVFQYTAPVYVLIFSALFFKKRPSLNDSLTVLLTMGGIVLFFVDSFDKGSTWGNIIGLLSGVTMALMFLFVGECTKEEKLSSIMFGQFLTAAVGITISIFYPADFSYVPVLCILFLGIFQLGIPYVLYGLANTNCSALLCCLIAAIEPILNPVWVALFTGEYPSALAILGGVIVIASITVNCIINSRKTALV